MMNYNLKKLTAAGMLVAVGVCLSTFAIPVGASKCFPIQHLINVLAGIFLGPIYGVGMAFCTSLIRNLMGTGSLLAFPGSMAGALLCGLAFRTTGKVWTSYIGEVIGTGVIGGMLAFPLAAFVLGKEAALFTYVLPFLISTLGGTLMAAVIVAVLQKSNAMQTMRQSLEGGHTGQKEKGK